MKRKLGWKQLEIVRLACRNGERWLEHRPDSKTCRVIKSLAKGGLIEAENGLFRLGGVGKTYYQTQAENILADCSGLTSAASDCARSSDLARVTPLGHGDGNIFTFLDGSAILVKQNSISYV